MTKEKLQLYINQHLTLQQIADLENLTRQRISQLIKLYFPELTKKEFGKGKQTSLRPKKPAAWYATLPEDLRTEMGLKYSRKKQNSKSSGWEWTIQREDIIWNTVCPILGLELDWFAESRKENSPSFDRIDSSKGYIPGNVQIISWRANRIKNDGTAEEHLKIANYLTKQDL